MDNLDIMTPNVEHETMNYEAILLPPRRVTSAWHLQQAKRLLDFDAGRHLDTVLVYAAVELRSPERIVCTGY